MLEAKHCPKQKFAGPTAHGVLDNVTYPLCSVCTCLFFIQTPLDLMMRPAPVDPAGRKCDHSEHPRSIVGVGSMFLEAPKNHQKNSSILDAFFLYFWIPKWHHFCLILHLFFNIFFDEKIAMDLNHVFNAVQIHLGCHIHHFFHYFKVSIENQFL